MEEEAVVGEVRRGRASAAAAVVEAASLSFDEGGGLNTIELNSSVLELKRGNDVLVFWFPSSRVVGFGSCAVGL